MATVTLPRTKPDLAGQRFVLYSVGWEGYQILLKMVENRRVRVTYDRGDVELMAPLPIHELYKHLVGRMIDTIGEELDIPLFAQGSTTFNREDVDRGLEPDECYYIASSGRVQDRSRLNLEIDPPPDLAIEIDITSSSLNRLGIYAALRIPEVWRFDGETLRVLLLQNDGTYVPSETSAAFAFLPMQEICRFLREYDINNDSRWGRSFRTWVRDEILTRPQ
jgi:Uma2 family endonuclease